MVTKLESTVTNKVVHGQVYETCHGRAVAYDDGVFRFGGKDTGWMVFAISAGDWQLPKVFIISKNIIMSEGNKILNLPNDFNYGLSSSDPCGEREYLRTLYRAVKEAGL